MPRYFFNIEDHTTDCDRDGVDLPGPAEAREQAIIYAGSLLRDDPDLLWDGQEMRIIVKDEQDAAVLIVHMRAEECPPAQL